MSDMSSMRSGRAQSGVRSMHVPVSCVTWSVEGLARLQFNGWWGDQGWGQLQDKESSPCEDFFSISTIPFVALSCCSDQDQYFHPNNGSNHYE